MEDFSEIIRAAASYFPDNHAKIGTVCAADEVKKIMKLILEPDGIETGWCKTVKGAFTDELGTEAVVLSIGNVSGQYIICGLINKPD